MCLTIGEILKRTAASSRSKVALICEGKQLTYGELNSRSNQIAHNFLHRGLAKGSRVALLMHNSIEMVETIFALSKIGAVGIPLNFRLSVLELASILEHSDATILIGGKDFSSTLHALATQLPHLAYLTTFHFPSELPDHEPEVMIEPDDEAFVIYTSGTTGTPKGVVLTHRNLFWNTINYTVAYQMMNHDVELALTPLFHSSTLGRIITYVFNGITFVTSPHFDPENAMELISRYKVTSLTQTPTMYAALLNLSRHAQAATDSVTRVVSGASPLHPKLKTELAHLFPRAGIFNLYGLTEASPGVTILTPYDPPEKSASVGKPLLSVKVKIVAETGQELPSNTPGEIVVRGPNVMKGYYHDPETTQETLRGGWLHTGDLGIMDPDGYLTLTGRLKELIISGGENIYPAEVEAALTQHPLIQEAAVIGVPDDYWGEKVKAIVVPKPGKSLTAQEVIEHCTSLLAHYKKPSLVEFTKTLPKNASGKVLKTELLKNHLTQHS